MMPIDFIYPSMSLAHLAHIDDLKMVVGSDLVLDIFLSLGEDAHTAWDDIGEPTYIYESPYGGKTLYRREAGDYENVRKKISE